MTKFKKWLKKWYCLIILIIVVVVAFAFHPWWYGAEKDCAVKEAEVTEIELVVPEPEAPAEVVVPENDTIN